MLIYEILLDEGTEHGVVVAEKCTLLNKLAEKQREWHPDKPNLSVPKLKPIKDILPDYIEEVDPELVMEMNKADDIKIRGKGW
jgi:hypothetical protein